MLRIATAGTREDDRAGLPRRAAIIVVRRILFAVKNPDARRQPGIKKAIHIAKRLGASLELYHAISTPVFLEGRPRAGTSLAEFKRESLELRQQRLEEQVARVGKRGVDVRCTMSRDYPPYEAIVQRATRIRADLIIAERHEGRRVREWLIHQTDWELLRTSPIPVLLLKNTKLYRRPVILAAVDPSHAHAKPLRFDDELVARGEQLSSALRGSFHAMHANSPSMSGLSMGDPANDAVTLEATYEQLTLKGRKDFESFAKKARIPRTRQHLIDGDPVFAIPRMARGIGAGIVVMGAVSRSHLKRVFIGSTAEKVLQDLPCDVLVVKPKHFTSRVNSKERGKRVTAPTPLVPMSA